MDSVYLTPQAGRRFEALRLFQTPHCGVLFGHTRARTFIVEDCLTTGEDILSDPSVYYSLCRIYGNEIIGFFSTQKNDAFIQSLLCPPAFGKIVLLLGADGPQKKEIASYTIGFNGEFFLEQISFEGMGDINDEHSAE
ncbi:MAG: hypothetical protein KKD59_08410 [Acidobacteria bacterium]|nr:hypothetical protein [Acidobacteriota bacterium]MBU4496120.1 hypothetical protein [Acidobacteriota bacterium]